MGYSIEGNHMHCMLPESQYPDVEAFIKRYLLGEDLINTDITKAPMFADVDWRKWVPWAVRPRSPIFVNAGVAYL